MAHTPQRRTGFWSIFRVSVPASFILKFLDQEMEQKFWQHRRNSSISSIRLLCGIGIVFMIAFVWQDRIISSSHGKFATYVRLYIGSPACFVTILATYQQSLRIYIDRIQFITIIIISFCTVAIFLAYQGTPYGLTTSTGMGNILILLFDIFGISIFMFLETLALVTIIVTTYAIPAWMLWGPDWDEFLLGDFFTVVTFAVMGACIAFAQEKRQRQAFATSLQLTEEQERYRQLLFDVLPAPIAQRCKTVKRRLLSPFPRLRFSFPTWSASRNSPSGLLLAS